MRSYCDVSTACRDTWLMAGAEMGFLVKDVVSVASLVVSEILEAEPWKR